MNCYEHPMQPAVAQCPDCGKGLCTECALTYSIPVCKKCNKKRINNEKGVIITEMLLTYGTGILLGILFTRWTSSGHSYPPSHITISYIVFIYAFSGIVPGWRTLTRITPSVFLILPIVGWLFYFIIKLALALCLGIVMLPIRTVRNIYRFTDLQKI